MKETLHQEEIDVEAILRPETELEKNLLGIEEFRLGLFWGKPRYGHPEGKVIFHIREILDNIELLNVAPSIRSQLRLIAFVHDTFKYLEEKSDWAKHHAFLARQFIEKHSKDTSVLDVIELHDEAYYSWRHLFVYNQPEIGQERLTKLLARLQDNLQLYYLFFKCDTRTGDKNQAPLIWVESSFANIEILDF